MDKSVIIIARNEKDWPLKTSENFKKHIPDAEIIGVDDGDENQWPEYVKVRKTAGSIGVGMSRRYGVEVSGSEVVMLSDAHVYYNKGDIDRAWELAMQGNIVVPGVMVMGGDKSFCGRRFSLPSYKAMYVKGKNGEQVALIGSVYFMRKDIALDVIGPSPAHGANEHIMTCIALALGYKIYAYPELVFEHFFKRQLNYQLSAGDQKYNKRLLEWWVFGEQEPENTSKLHKEYYKKIQEKRILNPKELVNCINEMNKKLMQ